MPFPEASVVKFIVWECTVYASAGSVNKSPSSLSVYGSPDDNTLKRLFPKLSPKESKFPPYG